VGCFFVCVCCLVFLLIDVFFGMWVAWRVGCLVCG